MGDTEIYFAISSFSKGIINKFVMPKCFAFTLTGKVVEEYTEITYSGLTGYVLTSSLKSCVTTSSPEKSSPTFVITASPSKAYVGFAEGDTVDIKEEQAFYLGTIKDGDDLYYAVKVNGGIYYVFNVTNKAELNEYLNPAEKEEPTVIVTPSGDQAHEKKTNNNVVLRIILTLGIVIPAVIVIILLFKPRKASPKKRREIEDDVRFDDFE